jgi:hypothetical protein
MRKTRITRHPCFSQSRLEVILKSIVDQTLSTRPYEIQQEYLCVLVNEYGFSPDQMGEELDVTGRGSGRARADFVIWHSVQDKTEKKSPLIIVECKSDNVTIKSAFPGSFLSSSLSIRLVQKTPVRSDMSAWRTVVRRIYTGVVRSPMRAATEWRRSRTGLPPHPGRVFVLAFSEWATHPARLRHGARIYQPAPLLRPGT